MPAPAGLPRRWTVADSAEMYAVRAWGGGYFAEIVDLLAAYAFGELNLNKIWSGGSNPAVYTTLKQGGWTMEGILRQHRYIDGQYRDVVVMALFRDQYESLRRERSNRTGHGD